MADVVSPEKRSELMAGIGRRDTGIELEVRRGLHARGFRYRLDESKLPGRPDIVLPKYSAVIQVHGCFWHGHDCRLFRVPSTNRRKWIRKFEENRSRDKRTNRELAEQGWRVLEIWECALKGQPSDTRERVVSDAATWITSDNRTGEISAKSINQGRSKRGSKGPRKA